MDQSIIIHQSLLCHCYAETARPIRSLTQHTPRSNYVRQHRPRLATLLVISPCNYQLSTITCLIGPDSQFGRLPPVVLWSTVNAVTLSQSVCHLKRRRLSLVTTTLFCGLSLEKLYPLQK